MPWLCSSAKKNKEGTKETPRADSFFSIMLCLCQFPNLNIRGYEAREIKKDFLSCRATKEEETQTILKRVGARDSV